MSAEGTNEIYNFSLHEMKLNSYSRQKLEFSFYYIACSHFVTLRAKAYDVKILNDVITSRHYVAIVCERSLRQQ